MSVEKGDLQTGIYRNKRVLVNKSVFISKLCGMYLLSVDTVKNEIARSDIFRARF